MAAASATRTKKKSVSGEAVISELCGIAFSGNADVKSGEKMRALELLGKHLGLFEPGARDVEIRVVSHIPRPKAPNKDKEKA